MRKTKGRLTTRSSARTACCVPPRWDEALDRAAEGFRRAREADTRRVRHLQLLEVHQRGELPGAEARPR